jgi:hypothetical protein
MITAVRSMLNKSPTFNFTIAVCDDCGVNCEPSRQEGQTGPKGRDAAQAAAHAAGWADRLEPNPKRRRRGVWTVKLLCPECQAKMDRLETANPGRPSP